MSSIGVVASPVRASVSRSLLTIAREISSWIAKMSSSSRSNCSAHNGTPPATWTSCASIRNVLPDSQHRTLDDEIGAEPLADVGRSRGCVLERERGRRDHLQSLNEGEVPDDFVRQPIDEVLAVGLGR